MDITFAHYRNRFCMFRTYYALAIGKVKADGINMKVIELPDPPSKEQEDALISGAVQAANLYLPNFLRRKLQGAPILGLATEWKSTLKGNGMFVRKDSPVQKPADLVGHLIGSHQGPHAFHRYLLRHQYGVDDSKLHWVSHRQELLLNALKEGAVDAAVLLDQFFFRHGVLLGVLGRGCNLRCKKKPRPKPRLSRRLTEEPTGLVRPGRCSKLAGPSGPASPRTQRAGSRSAS